MEDLVEAVCKRMQAGLIQLKQQAAPPDNSVPQSSAAATKQDIAAAAENIKREVSKVGIMWGSELPPSTTEAQGLLKDFQERVLQLCAVYNGVRVRAGAGATLVRELHSRATAVVDACQAFMAVVVTHGTTDLHRLAGRAFEAADAAKSPALDNRTAIGRSITAILNSAHDALREAKELAAAEEHPTQSAPSSSGAAEYTPDADFEPDACSEEEKKVVDACVLLVEGTVSLLRISTRALLRDEGGPALSSTRDDWENLMFHCQPLENTVNDLVAGLYPPQERDELKELSAALQTCCELLMSEFPQPSDEISLRHTEQLQFAEKMIEESYAAVVTALGS